MIRRKRVNLFSRNPGKYLASAISDKAVMYATVAGSVLFVAFLILSGLVFYQKTRMNSLLKEKEEHLSYLASNKNSEADTALFIIKKEQLKQFIKDDAQFLPYYNILQNSLALASNAATIQAMTLDKSRDVSFIINFTDYDLMYKYIRYIESQAFLKNFEILTLTTFSLNQSNAALSKGYQLNFEGKFKALSGGS
jgi:hypothetical protein